MMKFKVTSGVHIENKNNKAYEVGDVVESDRELDKIFKNKFIRVGEDASPARVAPPAPATVVKPPAANTGAKETEVVRTKKLKFKKVIAGKGKFNIVRRDNGKPINAEPLSKEEAENVMNSL